MVTRQEEQLAAKQDKLAKQVQNPTDRAESISRQLAGLERKRKKVDESLVSKDKQVQDLQAEIVLEAKELKRINLEVDGLRQERIALDRKKQWEAQPEDAVAALQPVNFVAKL